MNFVKLLSDESSAVYVSSSFSNQCFGNYLCTLDVILFDTKSNGFTDNFK